MLEFTCATCGKRVQADDASAGEHVLCPFCNATMKKAQPIPMRGCAGGVITCLISAALGFFGGFMPLAVYAQFAERHSAPWILLGGLALGSGSAFVGGLLGLAAGTIGGPRNALIAAFTTGILGALIGAGIGYFGGFVASGMAGNFALDSDGSLIGLEGVGLLGFIIGTIEGTLKAARIQKEKEMSAADIS